jgi:hypothetical protein
LTVKKGSFALDPQLGSEIYKLGQARGFSPENQRRIALSYAQEALLPMRGVTAEKAGLSYGGAGELILNLTVTINQTQYELESAYDI